MSLTDRHETAPMDLADRVDLHRLLTAWIDENGCDEMAARLVTAIENGAQPTRAESETGTACHHRHVREMSD